MATLRKLESGPRILVIDDEDGIREFLTRALARLGWAVTGASGEKAVEGLFAPGAFHCALVDIQLGRGQDGVELALKLRSIDPGLDIKMMSGDPLEARRVGQAGFGPLIGKPIDLAALKEIPRP